MHRKTLILGAALVAILGASGTSEGASGKRSGFSARVDNPWFPLKPGSVYTYAGTKDGTPTRDVVTVTHATRTIGGAPCAVVVDRLYVHGKPYERATAWYTQDAKGNVWYYGERTAELDASGRVTSTNVTFQAGRDGARPGILMPAHPKVGQSGRQDYYRGQAEDHYRVLSLNATAKTRYGTFRHAVVMKEWTPLERGAVARKLYVRGIGYVLEQSVGRPAERNTLVSFRKGT